MIKKFIYALSGKIVGALLGFLITPLLVRFLGSSDYGDYAFILSFILLTGLFTSPAVSIGLRKYLSEKRENPDWEGLVFAFYTKIGLAISLPIPLLVIALLEFGILEPFFDPDMYIYLYLAAFLILSRQVFSIGLNSLRGLQLEKYSEPLFILRKSVYGVLSVTLAFLGFGVSGVLIGEIVGVIFAFLISILILRDKINFKYLIHTNSTDLPRREFLSLSVENILLMSLVASLYHIDLLLLNPLAGSRQAGYYKAALVIVEFLWFVPIAVQTVMVQSTSELWSNNQIEKITEISSLATRYTLLITCLLAIGLISLVHDFVPLYLGNDFHPSIDAILLLLPGALGFAAARPVYSIGQANGNLRPIIFATAVSAIINLVLNIILIPKYGMNGAALATSISYGSMFIFHVISARSLGYDPLSDMRISRIGLTTSLSFIMIYSLSSLIKSPYISIFLIPPFGLIVYSSIAYLTNAIDRSEIKAMINNTSL